MITVYSGACRHHRGDITLRSVYINATGDDAFNTHGSFIVLANISNGRFTSTYIDETGPGWIPAAATYLVGDNVQFYSRLTLQPIGSPNKLVAATPGFGANATVRFRDPIPEDVKRYDMFISVSRYELIQIEFVVLLRAFVNPFVSVLCTSAWPAVALITPRILNVLGHVTVCRR